MPLIPPRWDRRRTEAFDFDTTHRLVTWNTQTLILALLRAGSDPCQTKFYQVAEKVTKLTHEIKEYHGIILAARKQRKERNIFSVSPLFNQLLENANAERDADKFRGGTLL